MLSVGLIYSGCSSKSIACKEQHRRDQMEKISIVKINGLNYALTPFTVSISDTRCATGVVDRCPVERLGLPLDFQTLCIRSLKQFKKQKEILSVSYS